MQSNSPRRVDSEQCSPCYTSLSWEENPKLSTTKIRKIFFLSSCWHHRNLLPVLVPLRSMSGLVHDRRTRREGLLLQGFPCHLPVLLCQQERRESLLCYHTPSSASEPERLTSEALFPPGFEIRLEWSDQKWTALSRGGNTQNALRMFLKSDHSDLSVKWFLLHVSTFFKQ